jgi:hypothetical protein
VIISEEIRLIPEFTGQTSASTEQSDLKLVSGYLVYTSSFGGNLVDEFTVRDFLDNSNNEQLATDFFNYLQSNYSIPDFNELYYNNLKLANVLNDYYGRTVVSNLSPTKTVANLQLTATTAITYTNTNFIDYNKRSDKKITVIVGYNTGDSYYINVPINRNYNLVDNQNYDKYRKNSIGNLVTKEVAEEFRYVIKKGDIIPNTDMIIKTNSFNDYNPRLPIGLNIPQIKIQFKTDRYIIPKNSNLTNIPIDIVFDKPAQFTGQTFALKIDYAEATNPPLLGSEIALVDGQNNSLISQNILINYGQSAYTANLIIKNPAILLMPDFVVRLNLGYNVSENIRSYSVSDDSFFVVNEQSPQIISEVNSSIDFVSKKTKTSPQVFLQSFVDLNYDDNESAFWLNPATTGFPEGFIVATPPVQPPPPAPHTGVTISNTPVDLTKNYLYNAMKNLGYHLISREGFGKSVVVMQGGGGVTTHLGGSNFGGQNPKIGQFYIYGYNLIRFDTSDIGETARIYGILKDFFDPYPL